MPIWLHYWLRRKHSWISRMGRAMMFTKLLSRLRGIVSGGRSTPVPPTVEEPESQPEWTCTHCGAESYNPRDREERYCGWCHHFCDDDFDDENPERVPHFREQALYQCPRCDVPVRVITREVGKPTKYYPCRHEGLLATLDEPNTEIYGLPGSDVKRYPGELFD